jgi:DNA transformation protein and related proteins
MAGKQQFLEMVLDQMSDIGGVSAKAMFGGHGLYQDGVFFAIISRERLYFKADDGTRDAFETRGLARFAYTARGKVMEASYYEAPPEVFDAPHEMQHWVRLALVAALRARKAR